MQINPAVVLIVLLLVVAGGWLIGRQASSGATLLLVGIAVGMLVSAPLGYLVLALLGQRAEPPPASSGTSAASTGERPCPPIVLLAPRQGPVANRANRGGDIWGDGDALPPIHFLGEE